MLGSKRINLKIARLLSLCVLFTGCGARNSNVGPSIEFTKVPLAGHGGPDRVDTIEGRVVGARFGQQIVLFARWGPWWVQPLADQPFTTIQPDSKWRNTTHFGTEYAALLVDPGYRPRTTMDVLPSEGAGVIVVAITKGRRVFWETWWFVLSMAATFALAVVTLFRMRVRKVSEQLSLRLEERVNERTRIARELHDTLLQSFHAVMFQFQAARNLLPPRAENEKCLRALEEAIVTTEQAIAEGRDAIRDLRPESAAQRDLGQLLTAAGQELAAVHQGRENSAAFRVILEGEPQTLSPMLQDETYRIGRELIRNAFRHANAHHIEVEIRYDEQRLRLRIRDDGKGIDPKVLEGGDGGVGHWGLSGIRERAQRIGAKLDFWSEAGAGTEVEITVPGKIAYKTARSDSRRRLFGKAGRHEQRS